MSRAKRKKTGICLDCNAPIHKRSKRCPSCATKKVWADGVYENRITEEYRRNHSERVKAAWERGCFDKRDSEEYRQKLSEAMKAVHERGVFKDPEVNRRRANGIKAAWERGDYAAKNINTQHSKAAKERWAAGEMNYALQALQSDEAHQRRCEAMLMRWERGDFDGIFQSPTSIEIAVAVALDNLSIEHESQYRPASTRWPFDEFVPPNILIELQGDYWHGNDFPDHQERDAEKAQWAKDNGYCLVVIWEHEIKEHGAPSLIVDRVMSL